MRQRPANIILAITLLALMHTGNAIANGTRYHETASTDNAEQTSRQSSDPEVHMTARKPQGVHRTMEAHGQSGVQTQQNAHDGHKVIQRYRKSTEDTGKPKHTR